MSRSGINGRMLNRLWNVGAKHALYHETGEWYHKLKKFPGALFDKFGYVMFETEEKFRASPYLQIKKHVNLSGTIKDIPDYVQFTQSGKLPEISQEMQEKRTRRKCILKEDH
jgi:5-methylcytosine-specific restriction protein A